MTNVIGIDVGKRQLDIDWLGTPITYKNDQQGINCLVKKLSELQDKQQLSLAICEATGGYERGFSQACHQAKLPIHVAHANKVRHFAKCQGLLAKTDKIDARVLSDYGRLLNPFPDRVYLSESGEKVACLLKRREQLLSDKLKEENRLDKWLDEANKQSINDHIAWLDQEIKKIEAGLKEMEQSDDIKEAHTLLTSIPAIGDLMAHYLIAYLPELGILSHKQVSALGGVAPFNQDSGSIRGKRSIQGGRAHLRRRLYMSAISAIRCNPDLKTFYTRLKAKGKCTKVAIIAVIHKLLMMANSVLRRREPWSKEYKMRRESVTVSG